MKRVSLKLVVARYAALIAALFLLCNLTAASFMRSILAENPPTQNENRQVLINEIKLGGDARAEVPKEYITLFNTSNAAISLAGWKLEYAKATFDSQLCQSSNWYAAPETANVTELSGTLAPHQVSPAIERQLNDTGGGAVHVVDATGIVQDLVGWSDQAPCSEGAPATAPSAGKSIQRYLDCTESYPVDTKDNSHDFTSSSTPNPGGLSGKYAETCQSGGGGSGGTNSQTCEGVIINELLPNPAGTDSGHEFIELYNPTKKTISLDGCSLQTSANLKKYNFTNTEVQPDNYLTFYDSQTGLTLPNSGGGTAWLLSPTDELQAINYPDNMGDGVAWARLGNGWQNTYTPTPGAINVLTSTAPCPTDQVRNIETNRCNNIASAPSLTPCRPDQYRNQETNRCRNIVTTLAGLKPCKSGQERNPTTNRCRSSITAAGILQPCKPNQTRNPATNRCRSTAESSSGLKLCQAGWQRNPQTHRCRKAATTAGISDVHDVKGASTTSRSTGWIIAVLAVLTAVCYGIFEWRQELTAHLRQIKHRLPIGLKK